MATEEIKTMNPQTEESNAAYKQGVSKKAFDSEYMTEWRREVNFLRSKGIRYTHVRIKNTCGVRIKQYKYTKTPELFQALYEYYLFVSNEKQYNKLEQTMQEAAVVEVKTQPLTSFSAAIKEFIDGNGS